MPPKSLPILALVFLCHFSAAGQVSIGLSAGPTLTFWDWKVFESNLYEPGPGWRVALPVEWSISPTFGVRGEVALTDRAGRISGILTDQDGNPISADPGRINFRFAEGSLLFKLTPMTRYLGLYVLAGGSYAYVQRGATRSSVAGQEQPQKQSLDLTFIERNHFLADVGAGWQLPLSGRHRLNFEGRFQTLFTDFITTREASARYLTVVLNAGYFYRL
jgi:hypothetical protein